jgi:hypothetical protein
MKDKIYWQLNVRSTIILLWKVNTVEHNDLSFPSPLDSWALALISSVGEWSSTRIPRCKLCTRAGRTQTKMHEVLSRISFEVIVSLTRAATFSTSFQLTRLRSRFLSPSVHHDFAASQIISSHLKTRLPQTRLRRVSTLISSFLPASPFSKPSVRLHPPSSPKLR